MWKKTIQLLIGFICGYLFIILFPIVFPFQLDELLLEFVLNPFEFFAAALVFTIGFVSNAHLIKTSIERFVYFFIRKKIKVLELFLLMMVVINFLILFITGFWQTVFFFGFSILYGIISLDFRLFKTIGN